jgi:hypothetical protein
MAGMKRRVNEWEKKRSAFMMAPSCLEMLILILLFAFSQVAAGGMLVLWPPCHCNRRPGLLCKHLFEESCVAYQDTTSRVEAHVEDKICMERVSECPVLESSPALDRGDSSARTEPRERDANWST